MKQKLLETGYFVDNQYLDEYIKLFKKPISPDEPFWCFHHIIPRSFFIMQKLPIDNSPENMVKVTLETRYKAYFYLFNCTKGLLKEKVQFYYFMMQNKVDHYALDYSSKVYAQIEKLNYHINHRIIRRAKETVPLFNKLFPKGIKQREKEEKIRETVKTYYQTLVEKK